MSASPEERMKEIAEYMGRARHDLTEAAREIPKTKWRQAPRPGAWSAAEVIAHLTIVEGHTIDGLRKITGEAPRERTFWGRWHLPLRFATWRGFKAKSPIPLDAELLCESGPMLARLEEVRKQTLGWIDKNRTRDLSGFWMRHPFFGPLNVYEWLEVTAHHENRHKQQIQEIAAELRK